MAELTNAEYAATLRALADFYEGSDLQHRPTLTIYPYSKAGTQEVLRAMGGKWHKEMPADDTVFNYIRLRPERFPGVEISVSRDEFCTRHVTYDCKPILSPDEEKELGIEFAGAAAA
jgi:hypothetical protein